MPCWRSVPVPWDWKKDAITHCIVQRFYFSLQSDALSAFLTRIAPANREISKTVIDPEAKKKYRYLEDNLFKRFFQNDRLSLLEEVFPDEKAGII